MRNGGHRFWLSNSELDGTLTALSKARLIRSFECRFNQAIDLAVIYVEMLLELTGETDQYRDFLADLPHDSLPDQQHGSVLYHDAKEASTLRFKRF